VRRISVKEARALVTSFHYLGKTRFRASYCFGIFCGLTECILGCIVYHSVSALETVVGAFGLSRTEHAGFWEIGRLVLRPEFNGSNLCSRLISQSIKQLRRITSVRAVITYAEAPRHTGAVYIASNFAYYGLSAAKNDFYVFGKKQERGRTRGVAGGVWRPRPRKHRFLRVIDPDLIVKWPITSPKDRSALDLVS
jgi:hypothetical protein